MAQEQWLALNLGNSRLHYAVFWGQELQHSQDYAYDRLPDVNVYDFCRVIIASVVPDRDTPWHHHPQSLVLTLADVPLADTYPTLGIDRALGAWGAGQKYGFPILMIDCGTAITLTGIGHDGKFVGGAIFPGLELLRQTLPDRVPTLPLIPPFNNSPQLWATSTIKSIESGIIHMVVGGIERYIINWLQHFPDSKVVTTGGDGAYLQQFLSCGAFDRYLIFEGMADCYARLLAKNN